MSGQGAALLGVLGLLLAWMLQSGLDLAFQSLPGREEHVLVILINIANIYLPYSGAGRGYLAVWEMLWLAPAPQDR